MLTAGAMYRLGLRSTELSIYYKLKYEDRIMKIEKNINEAKGNAILPLVVRSYFKNCGGCGQITTSDRWIQKTERNIEDHYRPICKKCAIWAELPVY